MSADHFNERLLAASDGRPFHLEFELPAAVFFDDQNVRIVGVGLSYGNKTAFGDVTGADRNLPKDAFAHIRGSVNLPPRMSHDGVNYKKPTLRFGNISVYTGLAPIAFNSGPDVHGADPVGSWSITLENFIAYKDTRPYELRSGVNSTSPLLDLKLYLRLRASPKE